MSHRAEFEPINPLDLEDDELEAYRERFHAARYIEDTTTPQTYVGSAPLLNLVREGSLGVGTYIRFWQTDLAEFYTITHKGLLPYNYSGDPSTILRPPFSRLDQDPATRRPYRWNVEDFGFISNQEVDELVGE